MASATSVTTYFVNHVSNSTTSATTTIWLGQGGTVLYAQPYYYPETPKEAAVRKEKIRLMQIEHARQRYISNNGNLLIDTLIDR